MKNTKKKIEKGEFGYIKNQQKRRVIYTVLAFIPPLLIFLAGLAIYGKRENVFTAFAAVACLPACKFAVGMIMMFMQKPMKEEDYQEIEKHRHGLVCGYEFVVSAYEKQSFLDSVAICGNTVVGYTKRLETMWEHREALEKDIKFKPDPDEPELTRNEKIKRVIGAISL